jgi:hypothetical protein
MSPVIHCLKVRPSLTLGVASFQACARFLRATAVRMNLAAVTRAPCSSGISFTTCGLTAFCVPKVSFEDAVLPK